MPTLNLSTANPMLLHPGGSGKPVVIANQDPTFAILIGPELGLYAAQAAAGGGTYTDPNITVIYPGQSYTFTGENDLYGLATGGSPQVNIAEDANNTQGALNGTSLVSAGTLVSPKTQYLVSAAGNTMVGPLEFNQAGYEMQIQCSINASATIPFLDMQVMWSDSVTGQVVAEEEWVPGCGPLGTPNLYTLKGPTKGNQLSLNLVNLDPGFVLHTQITVIVNSRQWMRDRVYTLNFTAPPGYVAPGVLGSTDVVGSINGMSVAPSSSQARLFPLYAGDVWFWVDQMGNAGGNSNFTLQVAPTSFFGNSAIFGAGPSGGPPSGSGTVMRWPRGHILMTYSNTGTSTSTVNCKAVALDERN